MLKNSISLFLCFITFFTYSQKLKVDLDRESLGVKYVRLPTNPVLDYNDRTFSIKANGPNASRIEDQIVLEGFEKVIANGTIDVQVHIDNIIIDNVEIRKREVVKKDKEGNVTSRKLYYKPIVSYTTYGYYYVKDQSGSSPKKRMGNSRNKFEGKEFSSYKNAQNYYNNNQYTFKNNFTKEFTRDIINTIGHFLNKKYGYVIFNTTTILWILDSKKNPEYAAHKKALIDIRKAFASMTSDKPVDNIREKIKPIVAYFESVIPKYPEVKKKKHRKMRYASYFNMAQMYYYLDMPDKAIEYANKLIENDYDKSDGKRFIRQCNTLKERFKANKITTRHLVVETVDSSNLVVASENESVIEEGLTEAEVTEKPMHFVANGDSEEVNKKLEKLLFTLKLFYIGWNSGNAYYLLEDDYIFDEVSHRIIGQRFIDPSGNKKYFLINLIWEGDTLKGAEIGGNTVELIAEDNLIVYIKSDNFDGLNYKIIYNSDGSVAKFEGDKLYNKTQKIVKEFLYKGGKLSQLNAYANGKYSTWIHNVKTFEFDSNSVKVNKITYKRNKPNIPKNEVSNRTSTYIRVGDDITIKQQSNNWGETTEYHYNEKDQIKHKKKYNKKGDVWNTTYDYYKSKLFKSELIHTKEGGILDKKITIYFSKELPASAEEYQWKEGKYTFDKNELVLIERGNKYKKKVNGIWSEWNFYRL